MKTLHRDCLWFWLLIALALQACATTSEDLGRRLVEADYAITESMLLATDLRTQGLINDEVWPEVKEGLNQARSEMSEAWASYDADPEGAAHSLGSIEDILGRLTNSVPELQKASSMRLTPRTGGLRNYIPPKP